jgi:hypothetical protein
MTQRLLVAWQAVPPRASAPVKWWWRSVPWGAVFRRLVGISSFPP